MQGSVREIAVEIVCADGSLLPVLMNSVLKRAEGARQGVLRTTVLDARERRRYEQELLRSARELEAKAGASEALALVLEGVVVVDGDGRLQLLNEAAEMILGAAQSDLLGAPLTQAVPGWEAIAERVPRGVPGRWPRAAILPLARHGNEIWIAVAGVATGQGTVYTLRDVTSEHELDNLRSEIVAVVSHELRTPLSAIAGAAHTLLARGESLPEDVRDQMLSMIVEQSRRQERVLDEILLTSRLESDQGAQTLDNFPARELLERAVDALAVGDAGERIVIGECIDADVRADKDAMQQVLVNLLENALKYAPSGSPVRVGVSAIPDWVRFTVSDEGPGISPNAQELVFEKFYRLDPQLLTGVGGVGLGLHIARELVRRMDGRIGILPSGPGATFHVDLPER